MDRARGFARGEMQQGDGHFLFRDGHVRSMLLMYLLLCRLFSHPISRQPGIHWCNPFQRETGCDGPI